MTTRAINTHKTNVCNEAIEIRADERDPNNGNASHHYTIRFDDRDHAHIRHVELPFQHGPIKEVGTNGITNEVLLAILIDRMEGFQEGPYRCRENAIALTKIEEALHWLKARTEKRVARGVEGTHAL